MARNRPAPSPPNSQRQLWIKDSVEEAVIWCDKTFDKSHYVLIYDRFAMIFYPYCDDDEVLFRLKWGHLIYSA